MTNFTPRPDSRTYIVGDVHGCIDEFEMLVADMGLRPNIDRIIGLGDLVDKGPHSEACLRFARDLKLRFPGSVFLLGNHEAKWLRRFAAPDAEPFDEGLAAFMREMPLFVRLPGLDGRRVFCTHGGIYPKFYADFGPFRESDALWWKTNPLKEYTASEEQSWRKRGKAVEKLMYTRKVDADGDFVPLNHADEDDDSRMDATRHWSETYTGAEGFVVYGHEPTVEPRLREHSIGIDTGCCFGGWLTAAVFDVHMVFTHTMGRKAKTQHRPHKLFDPPTLAHQLEGAAYIAAQLDKANVREAFVEPYLGAPVAPYPLRKDMDDPIFVLRRLVVMSEVGGTHSNVIDHAKASLAKYDPHWFKRFSDAVVFRHDLPDWDDKG